MKTSKHSDEQTSTSVTENPDQPPSVEEFRRLLQRLTEEDKEVLPQLVTFLQKDATIRTTKLINCLMKIYEQGFSCFLKSKFPFYHHLQHHQLLVDIYNDTIVAFIKKAKEGKYIPCKRNAALRTYLYAIGRNLALNQLKKQGKLAKHNNYFDPTDNATTQVIDKKAIRQAISKENLHFFRQKFDLFLNELKPIEKEMFDLLRKGYKNKEIAEKLKSKYKKHYKNGSVIKAKISQIKKKFRDQYPDFLQE